MKRRIRLGLLALVLIVALAFAAVGCASPPPGPKGATGSVGSQGVQGVQGEQGLVGPAGPQGESGQGGAIGATGATGATGSDGAVGTVGPRGLQGAAGIGTAGATGATGVTGATGATGSQGSDGVNAPVLGLVTKDSSWDIVDGQRGGFLLYNTSGPEFYYLVSVSGLASTTSYTLIYYFDPWPGAGGFAIAAGVTDASGNLFLVGEVDLNSSIPVEDDPNIADGGGKLWLVLSSDYREGQMTRWTPEGYLFEHNLISYTDTDLNP